MKVRHLNQGGKNGLRSNVEQMVCLHTFGHIVYMFSCTLKHPLPYAAQYF